MEAEYARLKNRFPTLPMNVLKKIYQRRFETLKVLTRLGLPEDVRWIIEAKVRLAGELHNSYIKRLPGMGKSSFAKKRRAKKMGVCYKCARWNCNKQCRNLGMVSINREDKIKCIKDGLRKESLDDVILTLDTHPSGDVHRVLLNLFDLFEREKERYRLGNLTLKDHVCQFLRKLDGNQISDS